MLCRWCLVCAIVVVFIATNVAASKEYVTVKTKNGELRGEKRDTFYAFEGIPYAKAPLGDLRLAPSVLNDAHWEQPRDALQPGPACIQWSHFQEGTNKTFGEEDCLFLNVYTTSLQPQEALPTFFFIHGGAFMFGQSDFYYADNLLIRPTVLVTVNYRLGPLGFLSMEDDIIPGNFGLKDQLTALRWVRKNIANFGGHKNNITLVGYSAGSASVQLHILSPLSKGLFKNAIGHSGSPLNPWVMAENSAEKARLIAEGAGCTTSSSKAMLNCLRQIPAYKIVEAVAPFFDYLYNPFSPLGVVVEKRTKNNPKPFLSEHPYTLMQSGKFNHVPIIVTVAEAEGLYPGAEFISKPEYLTDIDQNWNKLVPSILDYKTAMRHDEDARNKLSQLIRERYFGSNPLTAANYRDLIKIISNRLYFAGVVTSAKLMQQYTPVHLYYYKYKTKFGVGEYLAKSMENYGVSHGEDVLLVFKNPLRDEIPYTEEELLVSGLLVEMYDIFARSNLAQFNGDDIPQFGNEDTFRFLEVNYPKSITRQADQLSDEKFWNGLDFKDSILQSGSSPVKAEL